MTNWTFDMTNKSETKGNNIIVIPFKSQKRTINIFQPQIEMNHKFFLKIPKGVFIIHYNKLTKNEWKDVDWVYAKQSSKSTYLFEGMKVAFCVDEKEENLEKQTFYPALLGNIDEEYATCLGEHAVISVNPDTPNVFIPKSTKENSNFYDSLYAELIYDKLETLHNAAIHSFWSSRFTNVSCIFELNPFGQVSDQSARIIRFFKDWQDKSKTNESINEFLKNHEEIHKEMKQRKKLKELSQFLITNYKTSKQDRMYLPYKILK